MKITSTLTDDEYEEIVPVGSRPFTWMFKEDIANAAATKERERIFTVLKILYESEGNSIVSDLEGYL